jgi:uncharacterized protein (TIGR02145 family)
MIPRKQIGWSQEESLLWEISKQIDKTISTLRTTGTVITTTTIVPTTTTTTTAADPCPNCVQGTVDINGQIWDKCNLDVTTYRDGTEIPQVTDQTEWQNLTTGAWCYYNNDPANGAIYGKLYNWYAVAGIYDAASLANPALRRTLAPLNKSIPTDAEWTELVNFLGGNVIAGGKMKETGFCHWSTPNTDATNSSGFTGLPGGTRFSAGFGVVSINGLWWNSSEFSTTNALYRFLSTFNGNIVSANTIKTVGFSVRCLND